MQLNLDRYGVMKPNERYKQLRSTAAQNAKQYVERRGRRMRACESAAQALALFLGMPGAGVSLTELDEFFREVRCDIEIGSDIALRVGQDGFFYFGLHLHFEDGMQAHFGSVTLLIGVDATESGFVVKHIKSFQVEDLSEDSLRPFAQHAHEALLDHHKTPYSGERQSIGFLSSDSAA